MRPLHLLLALALLTLLPATGPATVQGDQCFLPETGQYIVGAICLYWG